MQVEHDANMMQVMPTLMQTVEHDANMIGAGAFFQTWVCTRFCTTCEGLARQISVQLLAWPGEVAV